MITQQALGIILHAGQRAILHSCESSAGENFQLNPYFPLLFNCNTLSIYDQRTPTDSHRMFYSQISAIALIVN